MRGLQAQGVVRRYGGLTAVAGVDLAAPCGQVTAVLGPNGAGKSTLFACLSGAEPVDEGRVLLDGEDVTALPADARARRGLGRTFQRLTLFTSLSVEDNLQVGAESRRPLSLGRGLLGRREPGGAADRERVEQVLGLLGLRDVRGVRSGALSTGRQRMVELGRALCGDPHVLLLDEPASGLDTRETEELQAVLRLLADEGRAVVLVEHDVGLVLGAADTVVVLADGAVIGSGPPEQVREDPVVRAAYLERAG